MRTLNSLAKSSEIMNEFCKEDVDPNIVHERSPNLYNKENRFWKKDAGKKSSESQTKEHITKPVDKKSVIKVITIVIILLIIVAVVARNTIFSVSNITVTGNENYSDESIITWSGVRNGMYLMTVNKKDIENNRKVVRR